MIRNRLSSLFTGRVIEVLSDNDGSKFTEDGLHYANRILPTNHDKNFSTSFFFFFNFSLLSLFFFYFINSNIKDAYIFSCNLKYTFRTQPLLIQQIGNHFLFLFVFVFVFVFFFVSFFFFLPPFIIFYPPLQCTLLCKHMHSTKR